VSNEHRTQNYDPGKTSYTLFMSERHNGIIDVITQILRLKYDIKYGIL